MISKDNYTKFDKTFMAFGSIMNAMQGYITNLKSEADVEKAVDLAWRLATDKVFNLVDSLSDTNQQDRIL